MRIKEGGVMDIQKEREAFEDWLFSTEKFNFRNKNFLFMLDESGIYEDKPVLEHWQTWQAAKDESHKQAALYQSEINHLAQANQQWREKAAKAQAVPEGYIIVPLRDLNIVMELAEDHRDEYIRTSEFPEVHKAIDDVKAMLEAQEPQ